MAMCSNCGANEEAMKLFDVISSSGIVKLCPKCLSGDAVALKKPTEEQISGINKTESLYNRLSKQQGLDPEQHKKSFFGSPDQERIQKQEVNLRKLIDRNNEEAGRNVLPQRRNDLIENFHWVIMRARRSKKMTTSQVAHQIGEQERVIKLAEQGVLPEGDYKIITKLETLLGINILRPEVAERIRIQRTQLGFDDISTREITIADLKGMKNEPPKKIPYWRRFMFGGAKKLREAEEEEINDLVNQKVEDDFDEDTASVSGVADVEFGENSVEISTGFNSGDEEESKRESGDITEEQQIARAIERAQGKPKGYADKRDLTDQEIDDLIFGRK